MESAPGSSPRGRGKPRSERRGYRRGGLIPARAGETYARCGRRPLRSAHPRAGGENNKPCNIWAALKGSSPRGRGKRRHNQRRACFAGLIPARAGKTYTGAVPALRSGAHPRAGGENEDFLRAGSSPHGSSPRGRGKLIGISPFIFCVGLIPARAGKTQSPDRAVTRCWAHPRAGGENALPRMSAGAYPGSSPRGRGKHERRGDVVCEAGLIPARAGKTRGSIGRTRRHSAHPRAGGENCYFKTGGRMGIGSSPRGRGKHHGAGARDEARGLIPARAGKTQDSPPTKCPMQAHPRAGGENPKFPTCDAQTRAHPRAGGENVSLHMLHLLYGGSSPRGRGKRRAVPVYPRAVLAHPRAGGENDRPAELSQLPAGSSPRGRGKRRYAHRARRQRRLIPARAGKTNIAGITGQGTTAHPRAGGENCI